MRRSVPVAAGLGAAFLLLVSGCSGDKPAVSTGQPAEPSAKAAVTTVELTLNGQPVDLSGATLKCYDYQGHLMVEANNATGSDASHFLLDDYRDAVALSIGVQGGQSGVFEYEAGKSGQAAEVRRDGDSISATGTIGAALDDSAAPQPFTITANCAEFVNTPPDSSKIDSSAVPSISSSCPPGQAVCLPEGN